ncbi:hypothetical protein IQ260_25035 [Leptolyngbya cf. ectocarpi LEGE 11479]|uniref:Uncharacterized protein n=1 Tax=Leptolyngbya cf. ectocarpi LEGE 11479 TaxID=1828722 RepID=A0A928ZYS1_LEPEC|nr:hypothetical protein [Leptolyngbya ectocarpi]MBE9069910.1 hypothetical protein [Leptolyngbya cf. ectocarpi LEGE 11479]
MVQEKLVILVNGVTTIADLIDPFPVNHRLVQVLLASGVDTTVAAGAVAAIVAAVDAAAVAVVAVDAVAVVNQ